MTKAEHFGHTWKRWLDRLLFRSLNRLHRAEVIAPIKLNSLFIPIISMFYELEWLLNIYHIMLQFRSSVKGSPFEFQRAALIKQSPILKVIRGLFAFKDCDMEPNRRRLVLKCHRLLTVIIKITAEPSGGAAGLNQWSICDGAEPNQITQWLTCPPPATPHPQEPCQLST